MNKNKKFKEILDCIGNTPLVKLNIESDVTFLAKLEFTSLGGSIKDRSALYMIEQAEQSGQLKPGGTIVEASSGNQGIALAMLGIIKGYNVIITIPDRVSKEKVAILRAYGADVRICPNTDDLHDKGGYHVVAENLAKTIDGAFMPDQYYNKNNVIAHYLTTGPEIWEQTEGSVTHFFAGAGTCGTISGVSRFLKEKNKNIKTIGIDAATSFYSSKNPRAYQIEGIGIDAVTETFEKDFIDEIIPITDEDSFEMTRTLVKKYGILAGLSSGAVMHVALEYIKTNKLSKDDTVVVIFADSGRSYLSKLF